MQLLTVTLVFSNKIVIISVILIYMKICNRSIICVGIKCVADIAPGLGGLSIVWNSRSFLIGVRVSLSAHPEPEGCKKMIVILLKNSSN